MSHVSTNLSGDLIQRVGMSLQYDGSTFCGWQKQKTGLSIQGTLEKIISGFDPIRPVKVVAAGRTDAGVHAAGQVVHFDFCGHIPATRWASTLNGRLPDSIRIRQAIERPLDWHACHSAIYRRYRYFIYNGCSPNIFLSNWSWHRYQFRLDEDLMQLALDGLIGFHDFSAFQRSKTNRLNGWTTIQDAKVERSGDLIFIDIQASGFLYGMVRLLVGQLVALGEHKLSLKNFEARWKECRRAEVRYAAPAKGLCLIRAGYKDLLFSKSAWFDTFPKYSLEVLDSPPAPP